MCAQVSASCQKLTKIYGKGDAQVIALDAVDVEFRSGRFSAVMGPSGSGKSTLIHCLAGLDTPTSGIVKIGDRDIASLRDKEKTLLRREKIGFIFQAFNLVPTLSAKENILLPLAIAGKKPDPQWYETIIDVIGLRERLSHKPNQLSGGQQQRVACARALITRPEIIFADEPTGNLDSASSREVLNFLRKAVDELGATVVMVTHDPAAAGQAGEAIFLADGKINDFLEKPSREKVLAKMAGLDINAVADMRAVEERKALGAHSFIQKGE